jgi:phosphatidate cytidylyltransferase
MPLNLPTLYKRTASAIVFAAIMLTGLLWYDWAFLILICVINFLCLREYFKLLQVIDKETWWPKWLPAVIQGTSLLTITHFFFFYAPTGWIVDYLWLVLSLPALLIGIPVLLLITILSKRTSYFALLQAAGGLFYITLPMLMLLNLRETFGIVIPLALVVMIWTNDTMAYFVGSLMGKTPFSPISPKKTWEGTAGGGILTIIAVCVFGFMTQIYSVTDWLAIAVLVSVAGPLGDLLESKLKRMADVKDSGNIMPGHGGALDRFDSLLIATPFVFVYVAYFMAP